MNYILGTGIAGLILGIKNPNYQLIGMDEGQTAGKYSLGPRIIQYSKETEAFLQELNFKTTIETVHIGYEKNGVIYLHLDDIPNFREDYSLFTRGKKEYEKSFLSGGQNTIDVICLDDNNYQDSFMYLSKSLYTKLKDENRIIKDKITFIDMVNRTISLPNEHLKYSNIISTLSQKVFQKISEPFLTDDQLQLKVKNFLILENTEKIKQFYTYSLKEYSRRTFFDGYQVLEIPHSYFFDEIGDKVKIGDEVCEVITKVSLPIQIKDSLKIREHPQDSNIQFRGRYSCWDHSILINKLIED